MTFYDPVRQNCGHRNLCTHPPLYESWLGLTSGAVWFAMETIMDDACSCLHRTHTMAHGQFNHPSWPKLTFSYSAISKQHFANFGLIFSLFNVFYLYLSVTLFVFLLLLLFKHKHSLKRYFLPFPCVSWSLLSFFISAVVPNLLSSIFSPHAVSQRSL